MKTTIILVGLMIFGSRFAIADDFTPDRAVSYKTIGDVDLKLHVFEPKGHQASAKAPAIVFFFGGGWAAGDPRQFYQQAREMSERGMLAFSAEYRVRGRNKTTPFECVKDGKSAIRWVRQHAAELGVDPNRIVASGGSAGGHVAACTGLIEGCEEEGENLQISTVPNAMILFNPVLDTTEKGYGAKAFKPKQQTDLSPCHQVRAGIVPTLLLHGTRDRTVPFENAERFTRLMHEAGNECKLVPFEGAGHGFFNAKFFRPNTKKPAPYEKSMEESVAFLIAHGFFPKTDNAAGPDLKKVELAQANAFPGEKSDFKGFDRYKVQTAKGNISVVCPKNAAPGKPWLWRSMFWGVEAGAIDSVTNGDLKLVEKGYRI